MKIVFDSQIFFLQSYGGISRYFASLAAEFGGMGNDVRVLAPLHRNAYLQELPRGMVKGVGLARLPARGGRLLKAFNHQLTRACLSLRVPDIVHETYYAAQGVAPRRCPVVVTVYDMIHELFAGEFAANDPTSRLKRLAVERADHVLCISESTRRDLVRLFGVPEEKLSVVHLGFNRMGAAVAAADVPRRPFLLYVGNRAGYKNFSGLLQAMALSPRLQADFDVIAFGGGGFSAAERDHMARLGLDPARVQQVGGDDAVLGRLYRQASAFVYPSLYEGFGLPPLEAMAQGCPVVSSNTSSMPEVIGAAAEFFDPADAGMLQAAIERVVYDSARQAALRDLGQGRLQEFSWERCAQETLSIYRKVAGV